MATYFVRKVTDAVSSNFPGVRIDSDSPANAVKAFAALPGHAMAAGEIATVVDANAIGFYSVVPVPTVQISPSPALPPVGT